ncbi:MAG: deoxyribodipyrimidine photo-lyase [Planctomycetia bacterium]|nr:deoxyribodipyrimidine photo-lyase [Planctomycetia bacterium]
MTPTTILWLRRDLRLDDNPALIAAAARGAVVPVFIWAPEEEAPWDPGAASRWWLHQSLDKLTTAFAKAGAPLVIRRGPSLDVLLKLVKETGATHVAWNRRYEPAVIMRDTGIKKALATAGLEVESFNGSLLYEPMHVATKQGKPYQVFSPFWRTLLARDEPAEPVAAPTKIRAAEKQPQGVSLEALDLLPAIDWAGTMRKTWSPGEAGAATRLERFVERGVADYARFPWAEDPVGLRAWQRGRTGFPIVDAGMRQLWATGWMHNRVRMIVASFLVKDLRISWLEGARWFWDTLVDADLAANTLGWQWAAGCGADAAPYFRIFNPTSQAEKFDPDGAYVKRWAGADAEDYPEPIVDHAEARKLALAALKTLK